MGIERFEVELAVGAWDLSFDVGEDGAAFLVVGHVVADFAGESFGEAGVADADSGDTGGAEDEALDGFFVRLAGHLFDDAAEDAVAKVGVGELGVGGEVELAAEHVVDDGGGVGGGLGVGCFGDFERLEHGIGGLFAIETGGVLEQLSDGDLSPAKVFCHVGRGDWRFEDVEDLVVEPESALLDQQQDGGGGDGF